MSLTYFIRIDGVSGDSTVQGREGWFELDSFNLSSALPLADGGTNGNVIGTQPSFSDISAFLSDNTALARLLSSLTGTNPINAIQIEAVDSDGRETFSLTLNEVFVSRIAQVNGDSTATSTFAFAFQEIGLATTDYAADGSALPPTRVAYDLSTGSTSVDLQEPTSGSVISTAEPVRYFLTIDGIDGTSTVAGRQGWIELPSFSLEQVRALTEGIPSGSATSGLLPSVPEFFDLSLTLNDYSALVELLSASTSGDVIRALSVQGVDAQGRTVYDLTLNGVGIAKVDTVFEPGSDPVVAVEVSFEKIGLETFAVDRSGALVAEQEFGWIVASNTAIDPDTLLSPALPQATNPVPFAATFFMKIDGVAGDVTAEGFVGWFSVSEVDLGSVMTGFTAGDPIFDGLKLTLEGQTALTALMTRNVTGDLLGSVKIVGVDAEGGQVVAVTLNDVLVTSVTQKGSEGDGALIETTLDFGLIGIETTGRQADGSAGVTQSLGWDTVQNVPVDAATLLDPGGSGAVDGADGTITYYLNIGGIAGGSTAQGYEGWFELSDFNLSQASEGGVQAGSLGRVDFTELNVQVSSDTSLATLLARATGSGTIGSVSIEGVMSTGDGRTVKVYDLTLNQVFLTAVDTFGAEDLQTSLAFEFGSIGIVTTGVNPDGTSGDSQSFGWSVVTNQPVDPATMTNPPQPNRLSGPEPQTFYIKIDGMTGDVTAAGYEGWFELANFSYDVTRAVSDPRGGPSIGTPAFSEISLQLADGRYVTDLLAESTTQTKIAAVEIAGLAAVGGTQSQVYTLILNGAEVTSVSLQGAEGSGQTTFTLSYDKIGVITTAVTTTGSLGPVQKSGWDLLLNRIVDPSELTPVSDTPVAAPSEFPQSLNYYMKVDGIEGDATAEGYDGWIRIESYRLEALIAAASNTAGGFSIDQLVLTLQSDAGLTALFRSMLTGNETSFVKIEGVDPEKGVAFELILNGVRVEGVDISGVTGDGSTSLEYTFGFEKIGIVTTTFDAQGNVAETREFGWDLSLNAVLDPDDLLQPAGGQGPDTAPSVAILTQVLAEDTGASGSDLVTSAGQVTLTGTASDDGSVASVRIFNGTVDLGAATLNGTAWTFSTSLAEGSYTLRAVATDNTGQRTETAAQAKITVDTTGPAAPLAPDLVDGSDTGTAAGDNVTRDNTPTLTGTAEADATVRLFIGSSQIGEGIAGSNGAWTITTGALADGFQAITATATDAAGNTGAASTALTVRVDTAAPLLSVTAQTLAADTGLSATDLVTSDGRVTLTGTAVDSSGISSVRVFDGSVDLGLATLTGTTWTFSTALTVGTHALRVVATDLAGNQITSATQPEIVVVERDPIVAQPGQRPVTGTASADEIIFGSTNQSIRAAGGDDRLMFVPDGQFRIGLVDGGTGSDTLDLSAATAPVRIDLAGQFATGAQFGYLALNSVENATGGRAGDILVAGAVRNILTGGTGADSFVFGTLGAARNGATAVAGSGDVITDFDALSEGGLTRDRIDLRGIDAISGGRDNAFVFNSAAWDGSGQQFTAAGQLGYRYVIGADGQERTVISGNIHGAGQGNGLAADFEIELLGRHVLSASDFLL